MRNNLKIVLSILISFVTVIIIISLAMEYYSTHNRLYHLEENFYKSGFNPKTKNIYLLGASGVGHLNATYINEYLNESNIHVYNLASPADHTDERLETINMLVSSKPKLVIYGLSFRDFTQSISQDDFASSTKISSLLPDPHNFFEDAVSPLLVGPELIKFQSPKFVILSSLKSILGLSHERPLRGQLTDDTPFFDFDKNERSTMLNETEMKIKEKTIPKYGAIGHVDTNRYVLSLKKIISILQQNGIKVIIFKTPYHPIYLDKDATGTDHILFESILQNMSKEYGVKIYDLHDKYTNLNIWYDASHITMNKKGNLYNEDIAKIISNEIK